MQARACGAAGVDEGWRETARRSRPDVTALSWIGAMFAPHSFSPHMFFPPFPRRVLRATFLLLPVAGLAQGVITLQLSDYATVPQSGSLAVAPETAVYFARVNFLREEPGPSLDRLFVCDLNGKLYILDKA